MKYAALCIMSKNQNDYLLENINYHRKIGFQHFFIYDNESEPVINIKSKDVTVIKWQDSNNGSQIRAYTDCLKRTQDWAWLGFIDTDEYIVLKQHKDIKDLLKEYENYGGLGIQWKCFGSSGHLKKQKNIIEKYVHASETNDDIHIKSIVRPIHVLKPEGNPHAFNYKNNKFCVNENKKQISGPFNKPYTYNLIQLNHYVTMSREDFEDKRKRGGGNLRNSVKLTEEFWERFQNGKPNTDILDFLKRM